MSSDDKKLSSPTDGIENLCEIVRNWAELQPCVTKAWVYGSRVRGEEKPESDLDVAVEIQWHESLQLEDESIGWTKPLEKGRYEVWASDEHAEIVTRMIDPSLRGALPVELHLQAYFGPVETPAIHSGIEDSSRVVYP